MKRLRAREVEWLVWGLCPLVMEPGLEAVLSSVCFIVFPPIHTAVKTKKLACERLNNRDKAVSVDKHGIPKVRTLPFLQDDRFYLCVLWLVATVETISIRGNQSASVYSHRGVCSSGQCWSRSHQTVLQNHENALMKWKLVLRISMTSQFAAEESWKESEEPNKVVIYKNRDLIFYISVFCYLWDFARSREHSSVPSNILKVGNLANC